LTALLTTARASVRFVAPFFDVAGASYLAEPIAAATSRRVLVQLYLPPDVAKKEAPLRLMKDALARTGRSDHFEVYSATERNPWPHLKVMVADSVAAYVGSANITGPGLRQGNLEFGVLVRGPQVAVIEGVVDLIPALERVKL
jgi:phosphatidylserine/phosphatidylglycerophosphate/cardiolipin synthase-like enzyme